MSEYEQAKKYKNMSFKNPWAKSKVVEPTPELNTDEVKKGLPGGHKDKNMEKDNTDITQKHTKYSVKTKINNRLLKSVAQLKKKLKSIKYEVGRVISTGDGVAKVGGLKQLQMGEVVRFRVEDKKKNIICKRINHYNS